MSEPKNLTQQFQSLQHKVAHENEEGHLPRKEIFDFVEEYLNCMVVMASKIEAIEVELEQLRSEK